jgi:hypothetical protein
VKAAFWSLFLTSLVLWFLAGVIVGVSENAPSLSGVRAAAWITAALAASLTQAWLLILAGYLFGLGFFAARRRALNPSQTSS